MDKILAWAKAKLVDLTQASRSLSEHGPFDPAQTSRTGLFGDSLWYASPNLWEPSVMHAVKDLCRPGTVVYDVGGNFGGITSAMSRLVGPNGRVCTFEASPRIIGHLQSNVVHQGHNNVSVYFRAVYSKSNETVMMYEGGHLNDSIFSHWSPSKVGHPVKTVALDDFFVSSGLVPDFIKMDIEGAEYDALLGAGHLIDTCKPHIVLEQQSDDPRCLEFLLNRGYVAVDLNTYERLDSVEEFRKGASLTNIAFVHSDRLPETPYKLPFKRTAIDVFAASRFSSNTAGGITSEKFKLTAGRYVFRNEFKATGTNNEMICGVRIDGLIIFRYHTYTAFLAESYRVWVIDVPRDAEIEIYFEFLNGTSDSTFKFESVAIEKLEGLRSPLWASLVID